MEPTRNEQKLINYIFESVMQSTPDEKREALAERWYTFLNDRGFKGHPIGSSWYVLVESPDA